MENKLYVSQSPHIRFRANTMKIMRDVLIALTPAIIMSVVFFGMRAVWLYFVCVGTCVGAEYIIRKIMKRDNTITDLSAVITGVLLAMNLPPALPLWMAAVGAAFAIIIVKQLFGGLGQNFANPAITARILLFVSYAGYMTNWANPNVYIGQGTMFSTNSASGIDVVASATPLAAHDSSLFDLFIGNISGSIGETCAFALLLGGIYLIIKKIISPIIPLTFIGTVGVLFLLFGQAWDYNIPGFQFPIPGYQIPLYQILSGGLLLGAIFMATDYSTSPLTKKGKFIFAIGCGVITFLIRMYANYPEGVSFAILLMNILTPAIDKFTAEKALGGKFKKIKLSQLGF